VRLLKRCPFCVLINYSGVVVYLAIQLRSPPGRPVEAVKSRNDGVWTGTGNVAPDLFTQKSGG